MIKVTNTDIPKPESDSLLVVEQFKAIPTPRNRLAAGLYYSFSGKWKNLFDLFKPGVQDMIDESAKNFEGFDQQKVLIRGLGA